MYPVGKAISGVVEDADSTLKLNISASTGSAGNVRSLEQGSIDLGLVSGDVAFAAVNGSGEFKDAPFKGSRRSSQPSIQVISNWMARDDSGIFYVHDSEGEPSRCRSPGFHHGARGKDLPGRSRCHGPELHPSSTAASARALTEVKNRTLDAIHGFTGVPISGLAELADAVPCHLLKYTDSELRSIIRSNPFYYMEEIPVRYLQRPGREMFATFGIKCPPLRPRRAWTTTSSTRSPRSSTRTVTA